MVPTNQVVLASASPRRQELLRQVVDDFRVVPADVDEESLTVSDPWDTATRLALAKAKKVAQQHPQALVIGSDTVVAVELDPKKYVQLSKPADSEEAVRMLSLLSGRQHLVITGVALVRRGTEHVASDTTTVAFRTLTERETQAYVATGEPMDKAGAYAIQGGAAKFVDKTEGSITNVIGLPLELLRKMLAEIG